MGEWIIEYNIMKDHIHMVMMIPPKYVVSDVIKKIKGVTSVNLLKKYDWLKKSTGRKELCGLSDILFQR